MRASSSDSNSWCGTIFDLRILMSFVPAIFFIGLLAISKFDLTEEKQKEITHELAVCRNAV
ncbi:hypothetical protein [Gracilibacillus boraciitolerans]|nr:hypothetical protein [Gracilibacillus boraciitolerans]